MLLTYGAVLAHSLEALVGTVLSIRCLTRLAYVAVKLHTHMALMHSYMIICITVWHKLQFAGLSSCSRVCELSWRQFFPQQP